MKPNRHHKTYDGLEEDDIEDKVEVDFDYIQQRYTHGDITVMHTWNFGAPESPEPCLVLGPTYMPPDPSDIHICVVELNDAWRWSREHNDDAQVIDISADDTRISGDQWQREMAQYFAMCLGLSKHDPGTIRRIRGIIEDHLVYLVNLPPAPQRDHRPDVTAEVTDMSSGRTQESKIRLN